MDVRVGKGVAVLVGVGVDVAVGAGVGVCVIVAVGVLVCVGVCVGVGVAVFVGVFVGMGVFVCVGTGVAVMAGVSVGVAVTTSTIGAGVGANEGSNRRMPSIVTFSDTITIAPITAAITKPQSTTLPQPPLPALAVALERERLPRPLPSLAVAVGRERPPPPSLHSTQVQAAGCLPRYHVLSSIGIDSHVHSDSQA